MKNKEQIMLLIKDLYIRSNRTYTLSGEFKSSIYFDELLSSLSLFFNKNIHIEDKNDREFKISIKDIEE